VAIDEDEFMTVERTRNAYGAEHGLVCANLVHHICAFLDHHPIARCFGAGTGFQLADELVRTPDVGIVRNEHLPKDGIPIGFFVGAPDIAVIVVSPTDKFDEIAANVHDYFEAGTRRVWIVRPRVKMVTIHRTEQDVQIIAATQSLNAADVLPGLEIPLAKIFG
jgi:Uma2 family endonuclease